MRFLTIKHTTVLMAMLTLIGCEETRQEESPTLFEDAVVTEVVYSPSRHGSGVGPTLDLTGSGGIGIAITSVDIPEKFAVVFQCQHGKFIVERKELWERLKEGQKVTIAYKELYVSVYDDKNKDGQKELVSKKLVKLDFLDAHPKFD